MMEIFMIYMGMSWFDVVYERYMKSLSSKAKGLPPNKPTVQQSVPSLKAQTTKPNDTR